MNLSTLKKKVLSVYSRAEVRATWGDLRFRATWEAAYDRCKELLLAGNEERTAAIEAAQATVKAIKTAPARLHQFASAVQSDIADTVDMLPNFAEGFTVWGTLATLLGHMVWLAVFATVFAWEAAVVPALAGLLIVEEEKPVIGLLAPAASPVLDVRLSGVLSIGGVLV